MIVGLDFDNVIANSASKKVSVARKKGFNITIKQSSKEAFSNLYGETIYEQIISDIYDSDEMYNVRIMKDAKKVINELFLKHQIIIISSRTKSQLKFAKEWLIRKNISFNKLIGVSNKSKLKSCLKNKLDIYLDDSISELIKLKNNNFKLCLFSRPFNKYENEYLRINSWIDFLKYVKSIEDH